MLARAAPALRQQTPPWRQLTLTAGAAGRRTRNVLPRPGWLSAPICLVYRAEADLEALLPLLSTYLGHVKPASTYWYLEAASELLAIAGPRLENVLGELP
jgi:integrase/recombinase XerD